MAKKEIASARPQPIQLADQGEFFEAGCAMEAHLHELNERITNLIAGRTECDTIARLTERRDYAVTAYDKIRRAS